MYSYDEVMTFVEEEDVKFIRLAFCDIHGRQKNISIMPDEVKRAFEYGIAIVGGSGLRRCGEIGSVFTPRPVHPFGFAVASFQRQGCANVLRY